MLEYHKLLQSIILRGELKPTRAKLQSTGKNVDAISLFGYQMRMDLMDGFPLLTTKKVPFRTVAHELLWFLSGSTNVRKLQANGVHIWDEWADENGELGPVYGKQWRRWLYADGSLDAMGGEIDQIKNVTDSIRETVKNPVASVGRRLIVSAWNVGDIKDMKLPPCHTLYQFGVYGDTLSCHLYARSIDAFLGLPFNIASYALLLSMVAHETNLKPRDLVISFGDVHIYTNHLQQVNAQLARNFLPLPSLKIKQRGGRDISRPDHGWSVDDFEIWDYVPHPAIAGEVAV